MQKTPSLQIQRPIRNILIVDLGGIGDTLLSTPALKILHERFPEAALTSLVTPPGKELLEGIPHLRKIVSFPVSERELASPLMGLRFGKLFRILRLSLALRRETFDMVMNFRPLNSRMSALKMALLLALIGARTRIGRDTGGRGFFLTHRVSEEGLEGHHEIDFVLQVVHQLAEKKEVPPLEIVFDGTEEKTLEQTLSREGIAPGERLIVFHPGAPFESKRWPLSCFIRVGDRLRQKTRATLAVVGTKEEAPLGEAFRKAFGKGAVSLCGKTSVKELCALLRRSLLFIGNDSGPMHLAAYIGTPVVALFHSGAARYRPLGKEEKIVVFGGADEKSFWERHRVRDRGNLDAVSEEEVFQAAWSLLERSQEEPRR